MDKKEITLSEEVVFDGRVFTVKKRQILSPNGKQRFRELVFHVGGACVLAVDDEKNVYMIRQFRSAFEQEMWEVPAGKLEPGEDPLERAKRELREETGLVAENYIDIGEIWPTVGFCNEKIYMYLATGLTAGETDFDEDEFIDTVKMPFNKVYDMCIKGEIKDGKTLAAVLKAKEVLKL